MLRKFSPHGRSFFPLIQRMIIGRAVTGLDVRELDLRRPWGPAEV